MTEGKGHTKGPWMVEAFGSPRVVALQQNGGYMPICDIREWGYLTGGGALGLPPEQAAAIQDANARLIAAAPDLLEALRSLLEDKHITYGVRAQSARSALRAAQGEVRTVSDNEGGK